MKPNTVACGRLSGRSFDSASKEDLEEWESTLKEARSGNFERRTLSKQTSMREMELKWEKRRRQALERRQRFVVEAEAAEGDEKKGITGVKSLTDEDMDELRGSIELGFGFVEEEGGNDLRDTLPALNFYFAVNRKLSDNKPIPSTSSAPTSSVVTSSAATLSGIPNPRNPKAQSQKAAAAAAASSDAWMICNPGDHPQFVKTRLRHWAQAVACSMRQSC
ncbi:uncharacterized protein LOC141812687 [Curcuma longa]|uniref:uncharacterized protein LOC141812687 n=1 Tax=Curcuma longa TaxID=136217 RepID=UPI003D9FAF5C